MPEPRQLNRRRFITTLGRRTFAVAVLGTVAGCASGTGQGSAPAAPGAPTGAPEAPAPEASEGMAPGRADWRRVNLGFVSAYVLVRDGEAAVVDTGVEDSEGAIETTLTEAGLGWDNVRHVILTHRHADHAGSIVAVLERADAATAYAGEADVPALTTPRPVMPVRDGDSVFGLQIVATPGHTPGHVCVLDPTAGLLLTGDALTGTTGVVSGPNPEFTEDMPTAIESVRKLGTLDYDVLLFGHGEPIETEGSARVAQLAAEI